MTTLVAHDDVRRMSLVTAEAVRHDEWLLDESLRESFPASDPASSSQPGSLANVRHAARERYAARGDASRA